MKAVYWKELRELAAVWIILLVWAVIFALDYAGWHKDLEEILSLATIAGIVTGAVHGLLDRYRRNDLFLAHRPLSALRLQFARTLAGVTAWLVPALVFLLLFRVAAPSPHYVRRLGRFVEPDLLSGSESLFLLGATAACWALLRLIVGTRRLPAVLGLVFILPVAMLVFSMRTSTLTAAFAVSLVIALVCTTTTVLGLAVGRRSALRAACLLLLGGVVLFQGLGLLRWITTDLLLDTYPRITVTTEGDVLFRDHGRPRSEVSHWYQPHASVGPTRGFGYEPPWEEHWHSAWSWHLRIVRALNDLEEGRRQVGLAPIVWRYEDGRFLCRHRQQLEVLAGFGRGGFLVGPKAEEGAPFDEPDQFLQWGAAVFQCVTEQHVIIMKPPPVDRIPRDSLDPVRVEISTKSLAVSSRNAWPERLADARLVVTGDQMLWVDQTGDVLFRIEWLPPKEHFRGSFSIREFKKEETTPAARKEAARRFFLVRGPPVGHAVSSDLEPVHPARYTVRMRVFRPDHPMLLKDIEVRPERGSEHAAAMLRGAVTLPLPIPVAVASYFSAQPRTWDDLYAWNVSDPFFAGGTSIGWLLASLALACACAWYARKQARMRCATERAVRLWMAATFLLGPLGLVWMRFVLGRETIEPIGGARRAVDLDASPATAEPWPEPLPTGTEVNA